MYPNLRAELARRGITIKELSKRTGISYSTLAPKVRGFGSFSVDDADKVRAAVGTNMPLEVLFKHGS